MQPHYHILNGDALKDQFPKTLKGTIIVARECLVDGPVDGDTEKKFFTTRARFIDEAYGIADESEYYSKTVTEFEKMKQIPSNAVVYLWFEDDLFCQVNFWFVCHVLQNTSKHLTVYLVRPEEHGIYGFGHMDEEALISASHNPIPLSDMRPFSALWKAYQSNDREQLKQLAASLKDSFPFIAKAVAAHLDRFPKQGTLGKPQRILKEIVETQKTNEFGPAFREFCQRAPEYGFGDLQVKRMWDQLIS